jgi:hypothetical protein
MRGAPFCDGPGGKEREFKKDAPHQSIAKDHWLILNPTRNDCFTPGFQLAGSIAQFS